MRTSMSAVLILGLVLHHVQAQPDARANLKAQLAKQRVNAFPAK
ncbi:MAG TPA: hypothetical protein VLS52_05595 [Rudaea sp.]|nr:hypothetical protein [Rudaea sp.]